MAIQTNAKNESAGFYKLNWAQRIAFGTGDLAQNLIFQTVACFHDCCNVFEADALFWPVLNRCYVLL